MSSPSTQDIAAEVHSSGFAFLPGYACELQSLDVAARLGRIFAPRGARPSLRLAPQQNGPPNTYSGNFGFDQFPLHTDLSHWSCPPRYLLLRCIRGSVEVPTHLLHSSLIIAEVGTGTLRRALVKPRRPIRGLRPLIPLLGRADGGYVFRWDELYVVPATERSRRAYNAVRRTLSMIQPSGVTLADPGDTVIIDNWKMLHGRAAAHGGAEKRLLERVYLTELQ